MGRFDARWIVYAIWALLVGAVIYGLVTDRVTVVLVGMVTLFLTLMPIYFSRRLRIRTSPMFIAAVALFLYATLFLGEVGGFYRRYWWWDLAMHLWSAVGFGLIGVILMLILVRGERMRAAPITAALFGFSFAVTIGTLWEIFEFAMDRAFGMNMQKSGLVDTMWDLIVDCLGGAVGAAAGFAYLKGVRAGPLVAGLRAFVTRNRHLFR